MASHYTFLTPLIEEPDWQKFTVAIVLGTLLAILGKKAASKISKARSIEDLVVPEKKFSLHGFFDVLLEAFVSFHDSILGKENRKYVPLCGSIFFFVFFANLLGVIPGMPAVTTTVWVNVGLAIVVFLAFNAYGIRENGLGGYFGHFCGPILLLAPVIFPLEILSTCLRMLTLNLRLYWNISADHIVLGVFTDLSYLIPVAFFFLGTFVAFMQAFVFTILTMIYILLAVQHGEEH